jgi:hypothetical protein
MRYGKRYHIDTTENGRRCNNVLRNFKPKPFPTRILKTAKKEEKNQGKILPNYRTYTPEPRLDQ